MTPVKRDDFQIESNIEVVHKPTGARISTYEYPNPSDACSTINVNWGRAGDRLENGDDYSREEVKQVACELLRELARKAA